MENIFRFFIVRPSEEKEVVEKVVLKSSSKFQSDLAEVLNADSPSEKKLKKVLKDFAKSKKYIDGPDKVLLGNGLLELRSAILEGEVDQVSDLEDLVQNICGSDAETLYESEAFKKALVALTDSALAMKFIRQEHSKPLSKLVNLLKTMNLIEIVCKNPSLIKDRKSILSLLNSTLVLPKDLSLDKFKKVLKTSVVQPPAETVGKKQEYEKVKEQAKNLRESIKEMMSINTSHLKISYERKRKPVTASESNPFHNVLGLHSSMIPLLHHRPESSPPNIPSSLKVKGKAKIIIPKQTIGLLTRETQKVLQVEKVNLTKSSYEEVVLSLKQKLVKANQLLREMKPNKVIKNIGFVGSRPLVVIKEIFGGMIEVFDVHNNGVPKSFGSIKSAGIGELLIVKQQLLRYEGGDIAHIENVLAGEIRRREHRRLNRSEQYSYLEEESSQEEEKNLQSTERFELQKETEKIVKEQSKLETGLDVSFSYGSMLQIEANLGYAIEKATEKSKKAASEYSKEIVNKSVSRISEKITRKQSLMLTEEIEERNSHEFSSSDKNITGVYQWVNKIYQAQVYNYGRRRMYDITIPEPGAFIWEAMQVESGANGLKVPEEEFSLTVEEIECDSYQEFVAKYEAGAVTPPPQEFITVAATFHSTAKPSGEEEGTGSAPSPETHADSIILQIEEGYEAYEGKVISFIDTDDPQKSKLSIAIGSQEDVEERTNEHGAWGAIIHHPFSFTKTFKGTGQTLLDHQRGKIAVAMHASKVKSYSIAIEIKCRRTREAEEGWRNSTHTALMEAYLKQKADYEQKLADIAMQSGVVISGRNPIENRKIEKDELKKQCISIMTRQHFEKFNSIENGSNGLPQIRLNEYKEEGDYIRFFEQAFEWENIVYKLYPYFWGRKNKWVDKLQFNDADPEYVEFVKAGAARVVIPARPGFGPAIEHFMSTGEIWNGGELPEITDEQYLPIVEEMKEELGAPGEEKPIGDGWEVSVPTSLVRLRPDGSLPQWVQDDDGKWISTDSIS